MNEMRVASMRVRRVLGELGRARVHDQDAVVGAHERRVEVRAARSRARSSSVPMMTRSGFMKSLTASPSLRNSGFDATANGLRASPARSRSRTLSAVPTGTVLLVTTTVKPVMARADRLRRAASTCDRSAEPSCADGVPTAMKTTSAPRTAVGDVGGERRAAARSTLRCDQLLEAGLVDRQDAAARAARSCRRRCRRRSRRCRNRRSRRRRRARRNRFRGPQAHGGGVYSRVLRWAACAIVPRCPPRSALERRRARALAGKRRCRTIASTSSPTRSCSAPTARAAAPLGRVGERHARRRASPPPAAGSSSSPSTSAIAAAASARALLQRAAPTARCASCDHPGNYLSPGLDGRYHDARAFFAARGFRERRRRREHPRAARRSRCV